MGFGIEEAKGKREPDTYFAPAARASDDELRDTALAATKNPLVQALLRMYGGIVAVLNEERQILAVNDGLLRFLGANDAESLLGLRPGEAFRCTHAHDHAGGCGTGRFCKTCGAAIAIVLSQSSGEPVERECVLTLDAESGSSVEFLVRAAPLDLNGSPLILLLLQDIRGEKRRQSLERVFFHDVLNALQGIMGYAELLKADVPGQRAHLAEQLCKLSERLAEDVRGQQILSQTDTGRYDTHYSWVSAEQVLRDVASAFAGHSVCEGRRVTLDLLPRDILIWTDRSLLHRVLGNMVKNALEATEEGGTVRISCAEESEAVEWKVWNAGAMPEQVALRIFQRFFSTKKEAGRGLGTYLMKLLGERYLGGKVHFTTSEAEGTLFSLRLPLNRQGQGH